MKAATTGRMTRQAAEELAARIESGEVRYNSKVQNYAEVFWSRQHERWGVEVWIMAAGLPHHIRYIWS